MSRTYTLDATPRLTTEVNTDIKDLMRAILDESTNLDERVQLRYTYSRRVVYDATVSVKKALDKLIAALE
jgi:hypothetical protein